MNDTKKRIRVTILSSVIVTLLLYGIIGLISVSIAIGAALVQGNERALNLLFILILAPITVIVILCWSKSQDLLARLPSRIKRFEK